MTRLLLLFAIFGAVHLQLGEPDNLLLNAVLNCQQCKNMTSEFVEKQYVWIELTNSVDVNGCKTVSQKCIVVDDSTNCETRAEILKFNSNEALKVFGPFEQVSVGGTMTCENVPGQAESVYWYEGQRGRFFCRNRCDSEGGLSGVGNGSATVQPEESTEATPSVTDTTTYV